MHWGQWVNDKYYSLEVTQQPIRARMCGFGDKDRRPLAPAAVAKMIVRDKNDIIIPPDDTDISFFVVTVDLWSEDGQQEMNLVLNPNSSDRYVPATQPRLPKPSVPPSVSTNASRNTAASPSTSSVGIGVKQPLYSPDNPDGEGTGSSIALTLPYPNQRSVQPTSLYPLSSRGILPPMTHLRGTPHPTPPVEGSTAYRTLDPGGNMYSTRTVTPETYSHQPLLSSSFYAQPATPQQEIKMGMTISVPSASRQTNTTSTTTTIGPPPSPPPVTIPRHTYTRTLVGPLCANACRLKDEHRQLGIFFLFQDLSVRTEGAFRLRMRLMNVGMPPAPEWGAPGVTTGTTPILAQTYTEPFTVYSAKRFPGVPDTTALSIAFGNQGQKLPLRNRNAQRPVRGKRKRDSDDEGGSEED